MVQGVPRDHFHLPAQVIVKRPEQNRFIDKAATTPYKFVPPGKGRFVSWLSQAILPGYISSLYGIESCECRGVEHLKRSIQQGHGIMLTPNHSRDADALAIGFVGRSVGCHLYAMANWHVFLEGWFQAFMIKHGGGFSLHREGLDKTAINTAIQLLAEAKRPLVIFPEGYVSRHNDVLSTLLEGPSLIAHNAAQLRSKESIESRVVVHPMAIKYVFDGDLEVTAVPILEDIERGFSWEPQTELSIVERLLKVGSGLLALKEVEYLGQVQTGELSERLERLTDHILAPIEKELNRSGNGLNTYARVKNLRAAILPKMSKSDPGSNEADILWHQIRVTNMALRMARYLPDYVRSKPCAERVMETVEGFEEDLTGSIRVNRPYRIVIEIGEAIEVPPVKNRENPGLMDKIEKQLAGMIESLSDELNHPVIQNSG